MYYIIIRRRIIRRLDKYIAKYVIYLFIFVLMYGDPLSIFSIDRLSGSLDCERRSGVFP